MLSSQFDDSLIDVFFMSFFAISESTLGDLEYGLAFAYMR
jgi:hypothetical protein